MHSLRLITIKKENKKNGNLNYNRKKMELCKSVNDCENVCIQRKKTEMKNKNQEKILLRKVTFKWFTLEFWQLCNKQFLNFILFTTFDNNKSENKKNESLNCNGKKWNIVNM